MQKPKLLLTNDDGIHSPGLAAAVQAVLPLAGDMKVIAPLVQQTAMGRALTGNPDAYLKPTTLRTGQEAGDTPKGDAGLCLNGKPVEAYACDASPARSVVHGLKVMPDYTPDLVISGINYGENLGANVTSSGTVGAAIEAACRGIPAIAVSLETGVESHYEYTEQRWETAMHFLQKFVSVVLQDGLPQDVDVLKIDIPACATPDTPWRLTRLSPTMYYNSRLQAPSLDSRLRDLVVYKACGEEEPEDTDVYAIGVDKVISVTPMTLDLTSRKRFSEIQSWLER